MQLLEVNVDARELKAEKRDAGAAGYGDAGGSPVRLDEAGSEPSSRERRCAKRFQIHTTMRYRKLHEADWREAMTLNISESGMLFQTDRPLAERTSVELQFELSARPGGPGAAVVCRGVIARQAPEACVPGRAALAAAINKYRFIRAAQRELSLGRLMTERHGFVTLPDTSGKDPARH